MAAEDATGYVYENVGPLIVQSTDGVAYVYENVGVARTQIRSVGVLVTRGRNNRQGVAYVYENVT